MRLDGGLPSFFLACILAELKKNVCCVNHKTHRGTMDKQSAKSAQSPLINPLRPGRFLKGAHLSRRAM